MSGATLATRVKAAREGAQLTMRGIAGVDHGLISRIESGKVKDPGVGTLTAIAKATGKTLDELTTGAASAVRQIELRDLYDDPDNPRELAASDAENDGLIASIKERGLILPLAVRLVEHEQTKARVWAVIDGHRRLMALRAINGPKSKVLVPCRVMEADDTDTMLLQLSANLLRADMNPWDLAKACAALVEKKVDTKTIAGAVGMGRRWVQEQASVGKYLCPVAIEALQKGDLSISQAVAIAAERNADAQYFLASRVIKERLNEDDIRALTADRKAQAKVKEESKQVDIEDLLDDADEETTIAAPAPVGGWRTWRSAELGYFKWQMLKHPEREAYIIETQAQWRREGSTTTGWSADKRKYHDTQALALGDAFELAWSEFNAFATRKDKATLLTSFLPWLSKGMRTQGADEDLGWRMASKFEKWVQEKFPDEKAKTTPATREKKKAAPKAPAIDISEPPEWARPMVGAAFMYHTGRQAFLCKGWRAMAKAFSEFMDGDQDALRELYNRSAWANDTEGKPFDFGGAVVRLTELPA